jgi:hypothetical protein
LLLEIPSSGLFLSLFFRQPLRHFLVIRGVTRPTLGRTAPAVIGDSHVDATVNEELHFFIVLVKPHQLVQDARGLMGAPAGVDIGAVLEKKVGDREVAIQDCPGERGVENLLHAWRAPLKVIASERAVGRVELLQCPLK